MENEYFFIDIEHLKKDQIFPFHLYVFNPANNKYATFLFANSPLIPEKRSFLEYVIKKNGKIAIAKGQKRTFLRHFEYKEDEIPDLAQKPLTEEEKEREAAIKILEFSDKKDAFNFSSTLKQCEQNGDYMPLIRRAQKEIICFSLKKSHGVSLSVDLAKKLLETDSHTNRIVATSYFLAKTLNITSETDLSDLINAAFFHHIGMTQLETIASQRPWTELDPEQKKRHQRHPGLSLHLLKKSKVILSERTQNIIGQHHERVDGSGFPDNKKAEHIDTLSLILGVSSFLFDYHTGRINGNPQPMASIVRAMKNRNFTTGLEFEFSDTIIETLSSIFDEENKELLAS